GHARRGRGHRRLPVLGGSGVYNRSRHPRRWRALHGALSPLTQRSNTMDRAEAFAILKEAAVEVLAVDPSAVTEEARFKEDLDADSLDLVEFVMALEERFDISVPEEDLDGVDTVGQALTLVLGKLGANASAAPRSPAPGRRRTTST